MCIEWCDAAATINDTSIILCIYDECMQWIDLALSVLMSVMIVVCMVSQTCFGKYKPGLKLVPQGHKLAPGYLSVGSYRPAKKEVLHNAA